MTNRLLIPQVFKRTGIKEIVAWLFLALLSANAAQAANLVKIKASATEEYLKERALNKSKKVQTYQFMKGHHLKGRSRDKSVEQFTFNDIIMELPQHLVKQNFYPNPVLGEGDLLIVVHYGATDFEDDPLELMGIENQADIFTTDQENIEIGSTEAYDLMDSLNATLGFQEAINSGGRMTRSQKAQMLGIDSLNKPRAGSSVSGYEYEQMLRNSRYFIVLMAYDYQHFRKTDKAKLLWSTRYSVRTPGQSFETAFKQMNLVASDYYGKNLDKLISKRSDDKSSVEIGDIEVIETLPPETDSN